MLTIQASCRLEGTWALEARAPHAETCDNMSSVLKLWANLQEKQNFIAVVHDDIEEISRRTAVTALRKFIEVDNHTALFSVKLLLDHHRVVKGVVSPAFNNQMVRDVTTRGGPEELTLRAGEREKGSESFRGHNQDRPTISGALTWSIQTGVRCLKSCMLGLRRTTG